MFAAFKGRCHHCGHDHGEEAPAPVAPGGAESALYNALRMSEPYPIFTVLEKLTEAADLLLDHRCYDGHGWELIDTARKIAPQIAADLRAALSALTTDEGGML